jgi:Galactose oxidase, central domain/Bacterial Ig domain
MDRSRGAYLIALVISACGGGGDSGGTAKHENQPPTLVGPTSVSLQQGRPTAVSLELLDPEGDAVTVTATPPAGIEVTVSGGMLEAFADYTVTGTQSIALSLTDAAGASSNPSLPVDVAQLAWLGTVSWVSGGPEAREHGALVVDASGKRAILIGGSGYAPQGTPLGDTWQYDLENETWKAITPSGDVPPPAGSRRVAQVSGQSEAYLFGGYGSGFASFDDFYRLEFSSGGAAFTKLSQSNPPPARSLHGFAFDRETQRFFTFDGVGNAGNILDDLWVGTLAADTVTWTEVAAAPAPSPRYGFFYGVDDTAGRLILFSGATSTALPLAPARDTWALDLRSDPPTWTLLLEGNDVPPGRRNGCFVMDPLGPRLFVFGGTGDGATSEPGLWAFDARPGQEKWTALAITGEPVIRSSGMAVYDPNADRLLFGFGNDAAVYRDLSSLGY